MCVADAELLSTENAQKRGKWAVLRRHTHRLLLRNFLAIGTREEMKFTQVE
jgi:hypothetical protein